MSPVSGEHDDHSIDTGQEAVARARQIGSPHETATALFALGISYAKAGRFEEAIASHHEAADLYRELNDGLEGGALRNVGRALIDMDRFGEAIDPLQRGATLLGTDPYYRLDEGVALADLGRALYETGRDTEAAEALRQAVAVFQEIGDRSDEGAALKDLGHILITDRRFQDAAQTCRQAAAILHETPDRLREGIALHDLSRALFETGQHDAAATAQHAAAVFDQAGEQARAKEARRLFTMISSQASPAGVPADPGHIDRAHGLAHLFSTERGGDVSDPDVLNAALAALTTCERAMENMRRVGRMASTNWEALDRGLASVRDGFVLASDRRFVPSVEGCSCGFSRIPSLSQHHSQQSPDDEFKAALRLVAIWAAGDSPAEAESWIQRALDKPDPDPDQFILRTVILFVHGVDQENILSPGLRDASRGIGTDPAAQTIRALMTAIGDRDLASAEQVLAALWHADPAQHRRRRYVVLSLALTLLGDFLLGRARAVSRAFLVDGGGYLADPAVDRAAHAALYTFEMDLVLAQRAGRISEASYLAALSLLPLLHEDFTLAASYTARR